MTAYRIIGEFHILSNPLLLSINGKYLSSKMKSPATSPALFGSLVVGLRIVCSVAATLSIPRVVDRLTNGSLSSIGLMEADDPKFSMDLSYDETNLPATPVLMNAVELLAQYAERDYLGKTRGRHGIVLESYPQVEFAVLPAGASTSMEVRLVIWAIYGGMIEIMDRNMFKQCDIAFKWDGRPVGNVYITKPLDDLSNSGNLTDGLATSITRNSTGLGANIGRFDWSPIYKPTARNIPPKDVFIMVMGAIKIVAHDPMDQKVPYAFHLGSGFANAHVEVYLLDRRIPRSRPPYFQYGHLLEALRQVPAWMLQNRRFAEMYCIISSANMRVGQMLLNKGLFDQRLAGITANASVF